jgi:hypothetical protein
VVRVPFISVSKSCRRISAMVMLELLSTADYADDELRRNGD